MRYNYDHLGLKLCFIVPAHTFVVLAFFPGGKTPFGQLPLLEVEGVTLCQSMTILRFVAKRHGMY